MVWIIGVLGLILMLSGFFLAFVGYLHFTVIIAVGLWLFTAFLNEKFHQKSNLTDFRSLQFWLLLILVSVTSSLLIELIGAYILPAWRYSFNFFDPRVNLWSSLGAYLFLIPASFEIFAFFSNSLKSSKVCISWGGKSSISILVVALILMSLPFFLSLPLSGISFAFFMVGFFFVSDIITYYYTRKSVLTFTISSLKNVGILFLTILVAGLTVEFPNYIYHWVWEYVNTPLLDITLLKVPIIILLGWVPLAGLWINLYYLTQKFSHKISE